MSKSGPHRSKTLLRYRSARSVLKLIEQKIEEAEPMREETCKLLEQPVHLFLPKRPDSKE
jgi:hypothetical protein